MRLRLLTALVLLLWPALVSAQVRPQAFTTVQTTDTSANSILVGCALGSTTCTGGIKAGTISLSAGMAISGGTASTAGIVIASALPASTAFALYNNSGTLTWNGAPLAAGSSISGTQYRFAFFSDPTSVGDSIMAQDAGGTTATITGTLNTTVAYQLNGTPINTTGTLTNVAYKGQNNSFTTAQTFAAGISLSGGLVSTHGIMIPNAVPGVLTTNLHNSGGVLTWDGGGAFGGALTATGVTAGSVAALTTLTANRIPYATATNTLGTSASLTFDGSILTVASASDNTLIFGSAIEMKSAGVASGAYVTQKYSRGTLASPTALLANDFIGGYYTDGYDGTQFISATGIESYVDGTVGTNDLPTRLEFKTVADGSATATERMRITSAGYVGIGKTPTSILDVGTSTDYMKYDGTFLSVLSPASGAFIAADWTYLTHNGADAWGPSLVFERARGTRAAKTIVQSGDIAGSIDAYGYDGAANQSAASIVFNVDGTPGASDMPGRIVFSTTADGAATATERMRITSAGYVGIGTTAPEELLHVGGVTERVLISDQYVKVFSSGSDLAYMGWGYIGTTRASDNAVGSEIYADKSRGTLLAKTIVQNGDQVLYLTGNGYDGSANRALAGIEFLVDGTPGASDMPGRIVFSTTADGAATPTERMRINNGGLVGINVTPTHRLHVLDTTEQVLIAYDGSNKMGIDVTSTGLTLFNAVGAGAAFEFRDLLQVLKTTEQLRLQYDVSNYLSTTVASNGATTFSATGAGASFTFSQLVTGSAGFSGNLTGNVTGNASGTAATVTTAAQPAITSVGTLTGLAVGGLTTLTRTSEQLRVEYDVSNYYSTTVGSTGGVTFNATGAGAAFTFSDAVSVAGLLTATLTTEQLRLAYDGSNYLSATVASNGAVTLNATGAGAAFSFSDNVTSTGTIRADTAFNINGTAGMTRTCNGTEPGGITFVGGIMTNCTSIEPGQVTVSDLQKEIADLRRLVESFLQSSPELRSEKESSQK